MFRTVMKVELRPVRLAVAALVALSLLVTTPISRPVVINATPVASTGSWTVYHRDNGHTGNDPTLPTVNSVASGWTSATLDGEVYAEPLIYSGRVYPVTLNNTVYAIDQASGATIWSKHVGAPQGSGWVCGNVAPQGILGTPVIDV